MFTTRVRAPVPASALISITAGGDGPAQIPAGLPPHWCGVPARPWESLSTSTFLSTSHERPPLLSCVTPHHADVATLLFLNSFAFLPLIHPKNAQSLVLKPSPSSSSPIPSPWQCPKEPDSNSHTDCAAGQGSELRPAAAGEPHPGFAQGGFCVCSLWVPEVPLLKPSTAFPLQPQTSPFGPVSPAHESTIFSFKASPESTPEALSPEHRGPAGTPGSSRGHALTVALPCSAERQREAEKF